MHWTGWDDEYLVYNGASGTTHLLNEVGAQALKILQIRTVDAEALTECLVEQFEFEPSEKFHKSIRRLLSELCSLGLIDTAPQ